MKTEHRPFTKWVADEFEKTLIRNDGDRPGHEVKGPWETLTVKDIYKKIDEECLEFLEAYDDYLREPTEENRVALQWESADLAVTVMMMSANVDLKMSKLRRGKQ